MEKDILDVLEGQIAKAKHLVQKIGGEQLDLGFNIILGDYNHESSFGLLPEASKLYASVGAESGDMLLKEFISFMNSKAERKDSQFNTVLIISEIMYKKITIKRSELQGIKEEELSLGDIINFSGETDETLRERNDRGILVTIETNLNISRSLLFDKIVNDSGEFVLNPEPIEDSGFKLNSDMSGDSVIMTKPNRFF